jgi:hypothetical protein
MNANAHLSNRIQQLLQLPTSSSVTQTAIPLGLSGMLLILALSTIGFVPALQS